MTVQGIDADVVARAEAALKSLSAQFSRWLQDEIDKLDAARAAVGLEGLASPAGEALYTRAAAPLTLVDSHINAIKSMIRDGIKTDEHPIGQAMVLSLEDQVAAFRKAL